MIVDRHNREAAQRLAQQFQLEIGATLRSKEILIEGLRPEVLFRVKDESSSHGKLKRREHLGGAAGLNDFLGIRILLCHWDQLDDASVLVRKWASTRGLNELSFDDWSKKRHLQPYRSVHIDFDLPGVTAVDPEVRLGIEIQITTYISGLIAHISHDLVYEHGKLPFRSAQQQDMLSLITIQSAALEDTIALLFRSERDGKQH